ncbi:unnamed protein product [Rotaria magnacalcarata]|uniref:C2H2-type domain-containing protein n=1 Tax=Rotaria magnacalcarata TaxID=392030 RepID=A0A819RY69_9BILA|nr:unnamed protein product [Rotaria magnacalcarata]
MSQQHYFCPLCISSSGFHNYRTLFTHIRIEHRKESSFNIRCELSASCGSRYSTFDSYRSHIYRYHHSLVDLSDNNDTVPSSIDDIVNDLENLFSHPTFNNELDVINDPELFMFPDEELDDTGHEFLNFDSTAVSIATEQVNFDKLAQFYTRFLLELREYHLLPQNVVQSISSKFCSLFDIIMKLVKTKASSSFISIIDMEAVFTHVSFIINSVSKSEYNFLKQCQNDFDYQPPTEIKLTTNEELAYYIPLNRSVKSNLSRQTNSNSLLLKLYTDGIGITNPIGAKKDSHKFTCFYYLLDDLPDIVRSQVNSIGLHCICYTKHLNNDNNRSILMNILVEDLNKLQTEGITIPCLSSRIYFVFSTLSGDNLASNEIGGFQKSFSSGSFCRHCFVTYEQRHIPLTDISFLPRTRIKHDMIVNKVIANNDGQIIQGVKNESWLKDLIGFHATESLPPDMMHDIAEGVCPLIINALLIEVIQQRLLTYSDIEQRTSCFIYGFYDSSNKPPPVKKQQLTHSTIAGTASQKLCLFRLFPIIFHDIIGDLTLLPLYTILREIISYIYANPLRESWLPYLDDLCKQFHCLMIEHLPDRVTPKVHFLTEYTRSIEMHGLPILNSYEDIDGSTLVLLQHNDIAEMFPRIKDRVNFVNQLAKLTSNLNEHNENTDGTTTVNAFDLSSSSASLKSVDSVQDNDTLDSFILREKSQSNNNIDQTTEANLSSSINFPDDNDDIYATAKLPSDYQGPDLPIRMQHYIDDNNIAKFNPHTALRGELLSLVFDDVTKSHKLLYPSNDEYLTMAKCLVKKLRVPPALYNDSVKDWHESIKQKFKRERKPLQVTTNFVKTKQEKYVNGKTNGRPKRKSTILQAERRTNDIPTISMTDQQNENLLSMVDQMKLELLEDDPDLDMLHNLWQQSFNIRRLCIRDLTVTEILERFPGYRLSEMILAEVKDCAGASLEDNVNDLLPKFFDHLPENNCFSSDVLPIRVIRILCKIFGDPVRCTCTIPCMKIHDDRLELYLDFCLITQTTSCFTALALLLSLYYVFEIRFGLHNRTCRLLYGILFEDSHYLNKALKNLLHNWQYKIVNRPMMKRQAMATNLIENSTQPSIVNKNNSSSSNNSNEIVGESRKQMEQDQYSSSNLNLGRSANIDQQSLNQHMDDDLNQHMDDDLNQHMDDDDLNQHMDDDEELQPLSIASPFSMSQCSSPVIIQNQTTSSFIIEDYSNSTYSEKTRKIYHSDKPSSKQQCEDEPDTYTEEKEPHSAAIKRKRKQETSSSSITTTAKQSARLAAKRIRIE